MQPRAAEIGAEGIGKRFGAFSALHDISMTIARGEFLTLLGPSGSGKTTFLMVLAGFEAPTTGTITLDGADVTATAAEDRAFGMVFQGYALFPHMTVAENLAFPLRVQRRGSAAIRRRVDEMIDMVGLGGHGHKRPTSLSGGQQQRVALARALIYEPSVLLLDEPFSALDKNLRGQMQDEVRRLHRETGTTFVFVTHDQSEALALSTRIAIFQQGALQQLATPQDVYDRPANRFVAEFLGDINLLPITRALPDGTARFEDRDLVTRDAEPAGRTHLAVRPEHMRLHLERPADANVNHIPARVSDLIYLGAETRLSVRTASDVALTLLEPTADLPTGLSPGASIWVSWPRNRGFFL